MSGCQDRSLSPPPEDVARLTVKQLAQEAFPRWALAHPSQQCPATLEQLAEELKLPGTKDPWGGSYRMYCGANLPPGVKTFAVSSPGPDGKDGTSDDVKSWP